MISGNYLKRLQIKILEPLSVNWKVDTIVSDRLLASKRDRENARQIEQLLDPKFKVVEVEKVYPQPRESSCGLIVEA